MEDFFAMLKENIDAIKNGLTDAGNYLLSSTISRIFFAVVCFVALINIIKSFLIWRERKLAAPNQPCKHLVKGMDGQDCSIESRQQGFKDRGYSCTGCTGRTPSLTTQEAEERASSASEWKRWIFCVANSGKAALPYISFVYTLLIMMFATGS